MTNARPRPVANRIGVLLGAFLAILSHLAHAEPALWSAHSGTATIYLFGTVHLLKDDTHWRSPRIERALSESGELWLEVPDAANKDALVALVRQFGMDAAHPLSTRLDPATLAHLQAVAARLGIGQVAVLEPMRPWMAGMFLSIQQAQSGGYDKVQGVDTLLQQDMAKSNRPVFGLETVQQQLRYFASLTPEAEVQMLDQALDEIDQGTQALDDIVTAWSAGDQDRIAQLMDAGFRDRDPVAYQALLIDRNVAWAKRLKERLAGNGVAFVAVGAGHLAGQDSLQSKLEELGVKVERE